jgi:hypothetical protein
MFIQFISISDYSNIRCTTLTVNSISHIFFKAFKKWYYIALNFCNRCLNHHDVALFLSQDFQFIPLVLTLPLYMFHMLQWFCTCHESALYSHCIIFHAQHALSCSSVDHWGTMELVGPWCPVPMQSTGKQWVGSGSHSSLPMLLNVHSSMLLLLFHCDFCCCCGSYLSMSVAIYHEWHRGNCVRSCIPDEAVRVWQNLSDLR